jgi:hypothetical protein
MSATIIGKFPLFDYEDVTFAESHGLIYPLTDCCNASTKGTEWGVCCRKCYEEVSSDFGACWTVGDDWNEYLQRVTGAPK